MARLSQLINKKNYQKKRTNNTLMIFVIFLVMSLPLFLINFAISLFLIVLGIILSIIYYVSYSREKFEEEVIKQVQKKTESLLPSIVADIISNIDTINSVNTVEILNKYKHDPLIGEILSCIPERIDKIREISQKISSPFLISFINILEEIINNFDRSKIGYYTESLTSLVNDIIEDIKIRSIEIRSKISSLATALLVFSAFSSLLGILASAFIQYLMGGLLTSFVIIIIVIVQTIVLAFLRWIIKKMII